MHGQGVVHGDLKGVRVRTLQLLHFHLPRRKANILIDRNGQACLADFSLITITSDLSTFLSSCIEGGTTQWMSPELLDPDKFGLKESRPTKESDCYALGMVIYEVLSGLKPYAPYRGPAVIRKVLDGERPERPQGSEGKLLTEGVWRVVQLCWKPQPGDRTSAKAVLVGLKGGLSSSRSSSPSTDEGVATDTDDQSDTASNDSGMFLLVPLSLIFNSPLCYNRATDCTW
jgi:serine/threonine protein kinase